MTTLPATKDGPEIFSLLYETSTVTSVGRLSVLRHLELCWLYVGQVMKGKRLQYYDNNVCLVGSTSGRWSDNQYLPVLFLRVTAELLVASYTYSLTLIRPKKYTFVYLLRVATSIEHYGSGDRVRTSYQWYHAREPRMRRDTQHTKFEPLSQQSVPYINFRCPCSLCTLYPTTASRTNWHPPCPHTRRRRRRGT
jgi:hypothetical protein